MSRTRLRQAIAACALPATIVSFSVAPAFAEEAIEEVVVTGSYIRRNTADSPSPLTVIDRAQIEQTGAIEIADIVNRMTFNSGSTNNTNAFSGGDNSTGQTNINIRNLGLGSTLVLVNGRRFVPTGSDSGGNQFVNTATLIPSIAIGRVEVVKDGASALYGSDAVAGVVNFITRDDFDGMELQFDYRTDQESQEQDDYTFAGIWGISGDRGSMTASFEYLERKALQIDDRYDDFGGSGVSTLANPGTFIPRDPAAITPYLLAGLGQGSPGFGDLDCGQAADLHRQSFPGLLTGDLQPLAGSALETFGCNYDFSPFFNLVGAETRAIAHVSGNYELSEGTEVYGEFSFSDQKFTRGNSLFPLVRFPGVPIDNPGLQNDLARRGIDPATMPNGVTFFGRVLGFTPDLENSSLRPVDTDTREFASVYRGVLGIRGDLPFGDDWQYDLALTRSERDGQARGTDTNQQNMVNALNGFGGPTCFAATGAPGVDACEYYNPFYSAFFNPDGTRTTDPALANSPELLNWMVGEFRSNSEAKQTVIDFVTNGELFEMGNGLPVSMAVGLQYRRDEFFFDADDTSNAEGFSFIFGAQDFDAKENTYAAFVELAIPLSEDIDIQLAARYEEFDVLDDNTFDPKLTALWRATDSLTLRASTGTSFRVGSLLQRFGNSTQLINIADPFSGAGLAFRPELAQGNANLDPETAFVWNLGLSWSPQGGMLEGLQVDLDYYDYDYQDLITRPGAEDLIAIDVASRCPQGLNTSSATDAADPTRPLCGIQTDQSIAFDPAGGPGLPDQVIRDAQGNYLRSTPSFSNAQELQTSGMDITVRYEWATDDFGFWTTALSSSWTREYEITDQFGNSSDGVGKRNANTVIGRSLPEWKANLSLGWQLNRHTAFAMIRYIDGYQDDQPVAFRNLDGDAATPPEPACVGSCLRAVSIGRGLLDDHVDSFTSVDVQYAYELPAWGWQAEGSRVTVGGNNVFNRVPPQINFDGQFDPFVHDPRGAVWYARYTMQL